ncbi:MAG: ABC transporter ATP-binding protein [Deferribacteres bacterium]|nr:ABC transporter ATP-binding protein [candidate division KSB1 bacterium]MCB9512544.1 ABC transporter ATP-binding protein [Deferribacteres bacterium]
MEKVLQVDKLTKTYKSGSKTLTVLSDVSFQLDAGSILAIVGPSGSGKTTLLGLCAGLDRPSSGSVTLNGMRLESLTEDQRAAVRNQYVGFVFQNFQLIPTLTALENVMIPAELLNNGHVRDDAVELLQRVGLGDRLSHYPVQLSGGEQQRVALARAFINKPKILFADEPTGNLDAETSEKIEQLLFELNAQNGTTLVLVTHNHDLAAKTNRIIRISGGKVISDKPVGSEQVNADALPSNL